MSYLDSDDFRRVVDWVPLISLDLLVEDDAGQFLLGERRNRPAQGYWFVPGGRVLKNETLELAFRRLTKQELGVVFDMERAHLIGPFEHFYADSLFGETPSTHYVILGYHLRTARDELELPTLQHSDYRWMTADEMRKSDQVHPYSIAYLPR